MPNIPKDINSILEKFIKGVKNIHENRMKRIILYGSYTRGEYKNNFYIDIMISKDLKDEKNQNIEIKYGICI